MVFIYILKLENKKYYVGKTTNPELRIDSHFMDDGSAWTKKYKPIEILKIIPNCDKYDEDKYTKKYMDKYGIDNVRGGSYVTVKLDQATIKVLQKMSNTTQDKCFVCSKTGHYAKDCPTKKEKHEVDAAYICGICNTQFTSSKLLHTHKCKPDIFDQLCAEETCYRCGREGHYASECYAKKHVKGYYIKGKTQNKKTYRNSYNIW